MPPKIKQDLNRAGWETTSFPSICEPCLPGNPYVQMLKEDHGAECKLCTRPFTLFRWKADRTARTKRTNICLTCARLKNCCQCCMLDLQFGLPIVVRDAALKMVAPGPTSGVNREYFAQNNERLLEEGKGLEGYDQAGEKGMELLKRLANSEPYYKKQRRLDAEAEGRGEGANSTGASSTGAGSGSTSTPSRSSYNDPNRRLHTPGSGAGPIRTTRGGRGGARGGSRATNPLQHLPTATDILPPSDPHITSLFVTGIEDDLPEHELRKFFTPFGALRSLICSHRAHSAFINYVSRESAEKAAAACQGRAVVKGVPLRVSWGKPKPLDNLDNEERMGYARQGRDVDKAVRAGSQQGSRGRGAAGLLEGGGAEGEGEGVGGMGMVVQPPPGQEEVQYASLAGD